MSRKYLNLVLYDFERRTYPLCRIDIRKHLFYANSETAQAAAAAVAGENKTTSKRGAIDGGWKRLPPPAVDFQAAPSLLNCRTVYLFSLLGGEDNVLYADPRCQTVLYNLETKFVQSIPSPNSSKRPNVISVSMPQEEADPADPVIERESLYVLDLSPTAEIDRCFEVFCYREKQWRWDILPPPPFFGDSDTAPDLYSYVVTDRSTICISSLQDQSIGTYAFDTVRRRWRRVADWVLPFFGKAEYVPELSLWVGLSACNPFTRLSALDLSATMDYAHPPVPRDTLEYLDPPEEDEEWSPTQLHLLNLGSGRFCVATFFGTLLRTCPYYGPLLRMRACSDYSDSYSSDEDMDDREYAVFTGLEVKRSNDDAERSLQLIKHMSKRYTVGSRTLSVCCETICS